MKHPPEKLKTGYTTGACAAAAVKAAVLILQNKKILTDDIVLRLPAGIDASFNLYSANIISSTTAACTIKKYAGDDPDITDGALITASVSLSKVHGIRIYKGDGVGIVTRQGLAIPPGLPAITEVPRKMITNAALEALEGNLQFGVDITISIQNGEETAKKTLNPRLGIIGGLSILGTTGIVYPFSTSAYKTCIIYALKVAAPAEKAVFTTGRRTEKFAQDYLRLPEEIFIQAGDYSGFAIYNAVKLGIKEIIIAAMPGKLSKMADGHFSTHANDVSISLKYLSSIAEEAGLDIKKEDINTAREIFDLLSGHKDKTKIIENVLKKAALNASSYLKQKGIEKLPSIRLIMFDYIGNPVGDYCLNG